MPDLCLEVERGSLERVVIGEDEEELEFAALVVISVSLGVICILMVEVPHSIGCSFGTVHDNVPLVHVGLAGKADADSHGRVGGDLSEFL